MIVWHLTTAGKKATEIYCVSTYLHNETESIKMDFFFALPFKYGLAFFIWTEILSTQNSAQWLALLYSLFYLHLCVLFVIIIIQLERKKWTFFRVVSMKYLSIMTIDFEPVDISFKLKSCYSKAFQLFVFDHVDETDANNCHQQAAILLSWTQKYRYLHITNEMFIVKRRMR